MAEINDPQDLDILDLPDADFDALLEQIPQDPGYIESGSLIDLPDEEFNKLLGSDPVYESEMRRATRRQSLLDQKDGTVRRALEGVGGIRGLEKPETRRAEEYIKGREGIRLVEDESPLSALQRIGLSFIEDAEAKVNILNQKILEDPRIDPEKHQAYFNSDTGDFVIPRYNENTGSVEDVVLDPDQAELVDAAEFVAPQLLPIMAEGLAAVKIANKYGRPAATSLFKGLFPTAAAGATVSRGQEAVARGLYDQPQQEVFDMLKMGAVETGFGVGSDLLLKGALRAVTPFSKTVRDPTRKRYMETMDRIKNDLNIPLEPTMGESTGSPFLGRIEKFLKGQWALGTAIKEAESLRRRSIVEGMSRVLNRQDITPDQIVNLDPTSDILADLDARLIRESVQEAKLTEDVSAAATREIFDRWDKMTTSQRFASTADAGTALRHHLNTTLSAFRKEASSKYSEVAQLIGSYKRDFGDQFDFNRLIKTDYSGLQKEVSKKATLFKRKKVKKESSILDPSGKPIIEESVEDVPIIEPGQIHRNVKRMLNIAKKTEEVGGMPIEFAIRFRQNVDSLIAGAGGYNQAGLGTDDVRILKALRSNIQGSIEDAADEMPTDALSKAMKEANSFYASKADSLKTRQIDTLLNETSGRKIPDADLLRYVYSDGKNYQALMETIGDRPVLKSQINRQILDSVTEESRDSLTSVSFQALRSKLNNMPTSVKESIFGKDYSKKLDFLYDVKELSGIGPKRVSDKNLHAEIGAVSEYLTKPYSAKTKQVLVQSLDVSKQKVKSLKDSLRRTLQAKDVDDIIENGELASILVDNAKTSQLKHLKKNVLGNGNKKKALNYLLVKNAFEKSGILEAINKSSALKAYSYKQTVVGRKLDAELSKPAYKELLDDDTYDLLDDFSRILQFQEQALEEFGGDAASIASAQNLGAVVKAIFQPAKWMLAIPATAGYRVMSALLTTKSVREMFSSEMFDPNNKAMMRALLTASIGSNEAQSQFYLNDSVALKDLSMVMGILGEPTVEEDLATQVSDLTIPTNEPQPTE